MNCRCFLKPILEANRTPIAFEPTTPLGSSVNNYIKQVTDEAIRRENAEIAASMGMVPPTEVKP